MLVVDDDVEMRRDVCEALEDAGYSTVAAANGRDAIRALTFERDRPCAVVLDVNMPEMDGIEFRRWLDQERRLRSVPVIVVSAFVYSGLAEAVKPSTVLAKPFSPEDLLHHLAEALPQRR